MHVQRCLSVIIIMGSVSEVSKFSEEGKRQNKLSDVIEIQMLRKSELSSFVEPGG